jgi:hypothetical protein
MIVVTEQEFLEWKKSRVTEAFMKGLTNEREYLKEMLLAGTDNDDNIRGRAAAVTEILRITYEELMHAVMERKDD